ncbi:MAG: SsrA-binding protein SmpB [Actinobacteria bacterium]|nr:SsrA-binding protein SmpB [Actinomycetota bacterium]
MSGEGERTIAQNRRARHDYHLSDNVEAGIALTGSEIKSLRAGSTSINEAYALIRGGEVWLVGATIEPYPQAGMRNHDRLRDRKLLLHRREIDKLRARVEQKGFTLVPLRVYLKNGRAKVELALGRGKDVGDKRDAVRARDARRDMDRALKEQR